MLQEIRIVALYEARSMVLSIRALLLVVAYGVIAGAAGAFYLWIDRTSEGRIQNALQRVSELSLVEREAIVSEIARTAGRPLAEAMLTGDLPPIALVVMFVSTAVIPGLIVLVGYASIAEDVSSKFARYVLQRVSRGTYLAGKLLAHWLVSYAAILFVHACLIAAATSIPNFELSRTLEAMPRIWIAMALFTFAYAGFSTVFSALFSPPFSAFAFSAMTLLGLWSLSRVVPNPREILWMGNWDMQLWALDPRAIGIYVAHGIVFSALAYVGLLWRDV